jgi:ADP-ribosylglycohydrolase
MAEGKDTDTIRTLILERLATLVRVAGMLLIGIGIVFGGFIALMGSAPSNVTDDAVMWAAIGDALVLAVPGAGLMLVAHGFRRWGARRDATLSRLDQAIRRMADAKARGAHPAPVGKQAYGARAGTIRSIERPTIATGSSRKSVIER